MTELAIIKGQREKTSSIGPHQVDLLDCQSITDRLKRRKRQKTREQSLLNISRELSRMLKCHQMK